MRKERVYISWIDEWIQVRIHDADETWPMTAHRVTRSALGRLWGWAMRPIRAIAWLRVMVARAKTVRLYLRNCYPLPQLIVGRVALSWCGSHLLVYEAKPTLTKEGIKEDVHLFRVLEVEVFG